jgi:4-nitrophenyl phosphatase
MRAALLSTLWRVSPAEGCSQYGLLTGMNDAVDWLTRLRALLIDLDGVVYRGEVPLPGAADLVPTLTGLGIDYAFVTNNATLTPDQYETKLQRIGIGADAARVVTSAIAVAEHLKALSPAGGSVCVVGEEGLIRAIQDAGFEVTDSDPAFVVAGLDRSLTYQRLTAATRGIINGARFIATNTDRALPVEVGLWPGAGAIVAAIATATGVEPAVIGKPEPTLLNVALRRLGVSPEEAAMVGDQVQTDIRAGRAAGMPTVLIAADLVDRVPGVHADLVVRDLGELLGLLRESRRAIH